MNIPTKLKRKLLVTIGITAVLLLAIAVPVMASAPQYVVVHESPSNPVFHPTKAYYPSILFDGSTYHMWYGDGSTTDYTTSSDGINWAAGTPTTGLTNANHPHVEYVNGQYMIWYWDDSLTYTISDIRCAVSNDGITWSSNTPLTQVGTTVIVGNGGNPVAWNAGTYGVCDVFYNSAGSATIVTPTNATTVWQNKFVMYYDAATGNSEEMGLAVSNDGINWDGYNSGVAPVLPHGSPGDWDGPAIATPTTGGYATFGTVLNIGGTYYMWYSGGSSTDTYGIGYAQSTDGINWTKYASNPIMSINDGKPWRSVRTYTPMVLYDAGNFGGHGEATNLKMWYSGGVSSSNIAIGYASITALPSSAPTAVGGQVYPVNKFTVMAPYLLTILIISSIIAGFPLVKKLLPVARKK